MSYTDRFLIKMLLLALALAFLSVLLGVHSFEPAIPAKSTTTTITTERG